MEITIVTDPSNPVHTCPNCNFFAITENMKFCPACGSKISWIINPDSSYQAPAEPIERALIRYAHNHMKIVPNDKHAEWWILEARKYLEYDD